MKRGSFSRSYLDASASGEPPQAHAAWPGTGYGPPSQWVAPCVICHQPAILRSPRGKPCHWTCAVAWVNEHQDQVAAIGKQAE